MALWMYHSVESMCWRESFLYSLQKCLFTFVLQLLYCGDRLPVQTTASVCDCALWNQAFVQNFVNNRCGCVYIGSKTCGLYSTLVEANSRTCLNLTVVCFYLSFVLLLVFTFLRIESIQPQLSAGLVATDSDTQRRTCSQGHLFFAEAAFLRARTQRAHARCLSSCCARLGDVFLRSWPFKVYTIQRKTLQRGKGSRVC